MAGKAEAKALEYYQDPPLTRVLFNTTRFAWLWTLIRVWLGYQWIIAGLHKIGVEAWTGNGAALKGFWERAVAVPAAPARPAIAFDWYRGFIQWLLDIQAFAWFAKLVAYGELIVGIVLVIGAFVGIAASFQARISTNPLLFTAAIVLILAWKVAGYYGLDRVLLPALGTPWKPGKVFANGRQLA